MKKASPIKEKIKKNLEKMETTRQRAGLLRETALLRLRWVPNVRKIIEYFVEALFQGAGEPPLDPRRLGESVPRAKLRAIGRELRHLQNFAAEVADEPRLGETLDPADRRLCEWAAEERREIMRLAVRFERRVGPAPEAADDPSPRDRYIAP